MCLQANSCCYLILKLNIDLMLVNINLLNYNYI